MPWKIAAVLTLLAAGHVAASEDREMRVMSFNVRYGTANDGPNHWDLRKDMLVDTIRMHDPHVVGLQECLDFQADFIVEQLPEYRWFGVGRDADLGGEMAAILYKDKDMAPIKTGNFWLSEEQDRPGSVSWDSSLTRIVTWAQFYHRGDKSRFTFFNTHFDHRGVEARKESARLLAERVEALDEDHAVIVLGDFNSHAPDEDGPWSVLADVGLKDAWIEAPETAGPETTWNAFGQADPERISRIDWILFRGPIQAEYCETVTHNEDGRYPSDHFPVVARLRMLAPPSDPRLEEAPAP